MSDSAKYRFFHWDNKPTGSKYPIPKSGNYESQLEDHFKHALANPPYNPTEPIEGRDFVESEPHEPYDPNNPLHNHPLLGAVAAGAKAVEPSINKVSSIFEDSTDITPQAGVSAKPVVYSDWSPISRLFGMSQDTAFSEHMANTAHQREVADLKAAGLNPVLGISGSGASSVSGNSGVGSSSALKLEEGGFPFLDVLGATAAVVTAVATKNPMLGYMVSNVFKAFD